MIDRALLRSTGLPAISSRLFICLRAAMACPMSANFSRPNDDLLREVNRRRLEAQADPSLLLDGEAVLSEVRAAVTGKKAEDTGDGESQTGLDG